MQRSRLPRFFVVGAAAVATLLVSSAPAMADASNWKLGYYTPSGRTLSFGEAGNAGNIGIASFDFTNLDNTALLVTDNKAKSAGLGDLSGKTVAADFTVSGLTTGNTITYFNEPDACGGTTAYVRYFFQTSNAGGFDETHYWWSNPVSSPLTGNGSANLAPVGFDGSNWSDFYGHFGNDPAYSAGFASAVSNITTIGLSFGGGCFFENGVGTTDGSGTFTLNHFTIS
jgi:hypothetical protein